MRRSAPASPKRADRLRRPDPMTSSLPKKLAVIFLASIASSSCASKGPTSTESYSVIVAKEVGKQKAADCAFFNVDLLPAEIQARLNAVPADPALRSPDQAA